MTTKAIKITSLAFLTSVLSFLSFYLLNSNLINGGEIGSVWPIVISFWIFLILVILEVIFIQDPVILFSLVLLQSVLPILAFSNFFGNLSFIFLGVIVLFLFSFWGIRKGHKIVKNNIKFEFFFIAHRIVPKVVTGILIFTMIVLYFNYIILGRLTVDLSMRMFDGLVQSIEPAVQVWTPGFSFNMTVDEALRRASEVSLQRSRTDLLQEQGVNIDELPKSIRDRMIAEGADNLRERIEGTVGPLNGSVTVRDTIFSMLQERVSGLPGITKKLSGGGILIILFFLLKTIAFIIYPLIEGTAFLIYKILNMTGFTYTTLEEKQQEIIQI